MRRPSLTALVVLVTLTLSACGGGPTAMVDRRMVDRTLDVKIDQPGAGVSDTQGSDGITDDYDNAQGTPGRPPRRTARRAGQWPPDRLRRIPAPQPAGMGLGRCHGSATRRPLTGRHPADLLSLRPREWRRRHASPRFQYTQFSHHGVDGAIRMDQFGPLVAGQPRTRLLCTRGRQLLLPFDFHPQDSGYEVEARGLLAEAERLGVIPAPR